MPKHKKLNLSKKASIAKNATRTSSGSLESKRKVSTPKRGKYHTDTNK